MFNKCNSDIFNNRANNYLKYKCLLFLESIYRAAILDNYGDKLEKLVELDNKLRKEYIFLYDSLSNIKLSKNVSIKFIKIWRNSHNNISYLILKSYVLFKHMKRKLMIF